MYITATMSQTVCDQIKLCYYYRSFDVVNLHMEQPFPTT